MMEMFYSATNHCFDEHDFNWCHRHGLIFSDVGMNSV